MAIHFSYEKCKDVDAASTSPWDKDKWHPIGEQLVWASIICGFNNITEANALEVWMRVNLYQHIVGGLLFDDDKPLWLTYSDIVRYIGLTTNADTKTPSEFWSHMKKLQEDEIARTKDEKSLFDSFAERVAAKEGVRRLANGIEA